MAQRKLPARSAITSLLSLNEDNPQLPAFVRQLPPGDLIRLVDYIGKEDAQALLVHATANQISELVETDAWISRGPGMAERFSPEKFLEWLELWNDSGAAQLCRRLKELGSDYFALTLHEYVVVVDSYEVGVEGSADRFDQYAVIPKNEEVWPLLFEFMTRVWDEDPDFLDEVLGNCCMRRSLTIEKTYITHNENLPLDVETKRDRHRRDRGYVTSMSSAAFLKRIRTSSLDELLLDGSYDAFSAVQLRNMQKTSPNEEDNDEQEFERKTCSPEEMSAKGTSTLEELQAVLSPLLQSPPLDVLLLDGPEAEHSLYLERQLARLGSSRPELAEARLREILYLSNILMEGTTVGGLRLDQRDAMLAATHTANLGLTYCVFVDPWLSEDELLAELLENEPGLIKAFNVGYRLLMELAHNVEQLLGAVLDDERILRRLKKEPELAKDIRNAFTRYSNCRRTGQSCQAALQQLTDTLSILCDASTCVEINLMADDFPRFPQSLSRDFAPGLRVSRVARFISEPDDLDLLSSSLKSMTDRLLSP